MPTLRWPSDSGPGTPFSLSDALRETIIAREQEKPVQQPVARSQGRFRQTAGRLAYAHGKSSQP